MDTMNYWIEKTPEALSAILGRVDVLVINDAEARELAETPNLVRAARVVRRMGPQTLVVKKGEHGALLFTGDLDNPTIFSAPAYPLEDVETRPAPATCSWAASRATSPARAAWTTTRSAKPSSSAARWPRTP